jgi:hypothetical protein
VLEVLRAVVLLLQYACELCRGRSNSQYWHAYVTQLALQASATVPRGYTSRLPLARRCLVCRG